MKNSYVKVYTTGDDQQVNCVISNDTQGITVFIANYRVFLHGMSHICYNQSFTFKKMMNFMKTRTFYKKKLPLFIKKKKKLNFAYL